MKEQIYNLWVAENTALKQIEKEIATNIRKGIKTNQETWQSLKIGRRAVSDLSVAYQIISDYLDD